MNSLFTLLLLASLFASAISNAQTPAPCTSLRWKPAHSQELSREQSLGRNHTISPAERRRLSDAIRPLLEEDDSPQARKLVEDARIKYIDLNSDGLPEVFVQPVSDELCSPTGNCPFWILRRIGDHYEPVLQSDAQTFTVQPTRSHGFHDIILTRHASAFDSDGEEYRFSGSQYKLFQTFSIQWATDPSDDKERQPLKTPLLENCQLEP